MVAEVELEALTPATFTSILSPLVQAAVAVKVVAADVRTGLSRPAKPVDIADAFSTAPALLTDAVFHSLNSPVLVFITRKRI